ncbi:unnamed protein product [Rotaria magnacalcarata]|uniref:Uncharacterized protein n=2 Tax=Rotaria magnacalcarata TaxID=392030 RepID=A0A816QPT8_9BILA|nr:unnamed protein product [Rotaria magnacalcarata]
MVLNSTMVLPTNLSEDHTALTAQNLPFQIRNSLETTVTCVGSEYNRTCLYNNLYYKDKKFVVLTVRGNHLPFLLVRIGIRVGTRLKQGIDPNIISDCIPKIVEFNSIADLEHFVRETAKPRVLSSVTVYFKQPWHFNIGHALFDGLYPGYMALTHFPPRHLLPFRSLIDMDNIECGICWSEDVSSRFSGLGIIKEKILKNMSVHSWFAFDELVMGNGDMCQLCIQPNFQLAGGVELDGSRLFRDRMYKQHGLDILLQRRKNSAEKRDPRKPLKAYFIHNKAFSVADEKEIKDSIIEINKYTDLYLKKRNRIDKLEWPLVHVAYVNYRNIKAKNKEFSHFQSTNIDSRIPTYELVETDFMAQLRLLSDMDIHITGPGTGQMYQTFLSDGSVTINLGKLKNSSYQRSTTTYASFMEQYMTAGAPYIKGLYYPINERRNGIKKKELVTLIQRAAKLITDGFRLPVNSRENLAADGQIFIEMCEKDVTFCREVTVRAPLRETSCFDMWAEDMVHEVRQWSSQGFIAGKRRIRCPLNHTLLRQLRQKYNIVHETT